MFGYLALSEDIPEVVCDVVGLELDLEGLLDGLLPGVVQGAPAQVVPQSSRDRLNIAAGEYIKGLEKGKQNYGLQK